jgi:hypothetical protein
MAQQSIDDPAAAVNQGLPTGTKLDSEEAGTGSPSNRKTSPERQKEKSLGVHSDPYADSKRKR